MADIRIKELTELTELTDNDYFVVDNSASGGETKKYRATRVTEMIDAVADEIEEKITPSIDTALAVGSVSGDIASFSDGSDLPMPKLEVAIESVQSGSGDPSPTNIRPISGWDEANVGVSGVNVWDEETQNGYWDIINGAYVSVSGQLCCKNYISVKPSITYYFYKGSTTNQSEILMYDKDKNYIGYLKTNQCVNKSFETPSNCYFITLNMGMNYGTTYLEDISINYPSTDTEYHAYNTDSHTYTIDLDGTRYGGKVDLVSGVLTVDRASLKLNDLIWTKQNTTNNNWRFKTGQSIQNIKIPTSAAYKIDNLCSVYRNVTANETWTADNTGIAVNADASLLICDLNQVDVTALNTVLANQTYCYELATPIEIQLTPTQVSSLMGVNNIWADCGKIIDCEYKRDATAIINSLIARIEALENQ